MKFIREEGRSCYGEEEEEWKVGHHLKIQCSLHYRLVTLDFLRHIWTPIASLKGQIQGYFYSMKAHSYGQILQSSDQHNTAGWRPSRERLYYRLPVDRRSSSRRCGELDCHWMNRQTQADARTLFTSYTRCIPTFLCTVGFTWVKYHFCDSLLKRVDQ